MSGDRSLRGGLRAVRLPTEGPLQVRRLLVHGVVVFRPARRRQVHVVSNAVHSSANDVLPTARSCHAVLLVGVPTGYERSHRDAHGARVRSHERADQVLGEQRLEHGARHRQTSARHGRRNSGDRSDRADRRAAAHGGHHPLPDGSGGHVRKARGVPVFVRRIGRRAPTDRHPHLATMLFAHMSLLCFAGTAPTPPLDRTWSCSP